MAKHEFGIMQTVPEKGKRYDQYEPEKYNCISIDEMYLENIAAEFNHIDFYWHTIEIKGKGIAYCGVTLIPPTSMNAFADVIKNADGLSELRELVNTALKEDKWLIHFGV